MAPTGEDGETVSDKSARIALLATLTAGFLGIFLVPWFVPPWQALCSASYTLGFNNTVASLALVALLAALFLRHLRRPAQRASVAAKVLEGMLSPPGSVAGARHLFIAFVSMTALTVALLLAWYLILPYIYFGEFGSDVSRLDLMALGMKPHRDFQYNYGPAMLYLPYWLYRAFGDRLSIDAAHCVSLLLHWVAGLSLLYYTVGNLCRGLSGTVVFISTSLAVFNITLGVGYTPLRFILPLASLLFLHRTFSRWIDLGSAGTFRLLAGLAVTVLLPLASLSISPEIGVSTAVGIFAYFAALYFTPFRRFSPLALAPLVALGSAVLVFSVNYADGILSVGGGANNFPVFPSPYILFFVAASCVVLPHLGAIGVRERNLNGSFAAALVAGLGVLIPAALGRCDIGHVLFNGLGIFVLFLAVVVQWRRRTAALVVGAFVLTFPVLNAYSTIGNRDFRRARALGTAIAHGTVLFDTRANRNIWREASGTSPNLRYGKLLPFRDDLKKLLRYDAIGTPFYPSEDIDRFLKLSGRFSPEYYTGVNIQVYTPSEVNRKLRDLERMRTLLVPKDHYHYPVLVQEYLPQHLSEWLVFPSFLIPQRRNTPYIPGFEIVKYIENNFVVVGEFRTYEIWRR